MNYNIYNYIISHFSIKAIKSDPKVKAIMEHIIVLWCFLSEKTETDHNHVFSVPQVLFPNSLEAVVAYEPFNKVF